MMGPLILPPERGGEAPSSETRCGGSGLIKWSGDLTASAGQATEKHSAGHYTCPGCPDCQSAPPSSEARSRWAQCPGCFSVTQITVGDPRKYWECDCGEALTVIDLREVEPAPVGEADTPLEPPDDDPPSMRETTPDTPQEREERGGLREAISEAYAALVGGDGPPDTTTAQLWLRTTLPKDHPNYWPREALNPSSEEGERG